MKEWWEQEWQGAPIGTPEIVREVLERAGNLFKMRPDLEMGEKLQLFFMDALVPYFDCLWEGMDETAGHIVYRLSDRLPPHIRSNIGVYPRAVRRDQTSPLGYNVDMKANMSGWTTLEEWRREWETQHRNIPPLQELLPEGISLQLGGGSPEPEPAPEPKLELQPAYDSRGEPAGGIIDVTSTPVSNKSERALYWVCRLATLCQDDLSRSCALSYLEEVGYDWQRVKQTIHEGEPT